MHIFKAINGLLVLAMVAGCASPGGAKGPRGPQLEVSGASTESGQYAQVGVRFTSVGDFTAIINPYRWKEPLQTGGSLSWLNPEAWSDDASRTGRILAGEAVVVGTAVVAAASAGGGGGSSGGSSSSSTPPPPTGGGGGSPPPPPP